MQLNPCGAQCLAVSVRTRGETRKAVYAPSQQRQTDSAQVAIFPEKTAGKAGEGTFVIEGPGEYDVAGFMVHVVPLAAKSSAVVFSSDDCRCAILSSSVGKLSDAHVAAIGEVDALVYAIADKNASSLRGLEAIHQIEPSALILLGPSDACQAALRELGVKKPEMHTSYSCKKALGENEEMQVVVLGKS